MEEARKTILVVDDSAVLRRIVINALDIFPFNVLEAENAKVAEKLLEENEVDLIILDWVMPGKSGYELFMELQEDQRDGKIPVIMLSSESGKEMILKAIRSGIKHYVTKPFTHEDLLARVIRVLKLDV